MRPRQIYKGHTKRNYEDMNMRQKKVDQDLDYKIATTDVRREASLAHAKQLRREAKKKAREASGA